MTCEPCSFISFAARRAEDRRALPNLSVRPVAVNFVHIHASADEIRIAPETELPRRPIECQHHGVRGFVGIVSRELNRLLRLACVEKQTRMIDGELRKL